jgi:hypothetical protein
MLLSAAACVSVVISFFDELQAEKKEIIIMVMMIGYFIGI